MRWILLILVLGFALQGEAQHALGFLKGAPGGQFVKDTLTVKLYDAPNGKSVSEGKLIFSGTYWYLQVPKNLGYISREWYETMCYSAPHLKYYDITMDGHYKILGLHRNGGLWLKYQDVEERLLPTSFLQDITTGKASWQYFGYHNYRLRNEPSPEGEVIIRLNNQLHVIGKFTGLTMNEWAEVIIYETKHPMSGCYMEKELKAARTGVQYKGWIKVVDDNRQVKDIKYHRCC